MEPLSSVDLSKRPIPVPRTSIDSKKPVPLPRSISKEQPGVSIDKEKCSRVEYNQGDINTTSNHDTVKTSLTAGLTKLHEKGKAVIEGKRSMSSILGRSMRIGRGLNDKRWTILNPPSSKEDESQISNLQRSHSFPSQDIDPFESITFQSPLNSKNEAASNFSESYEMGFENTSSDGSPSPPPPLYPPPPPPDESVYDEVQSVISNNSSSVNSCDQNYFSTGSMCGSNEDSECYYEDVSMTRVQNVSPWSSNSVNAHIVRSDSWSHYKPLNFENKSKSYCGDVYQDSLPLSNELALLSNSNVYEQGPSTAAFSNRSKPSFSQSSDSALDDLEEQSYGDDDPFSPNSVGRLSSCSVRNELYMNWDLPCTPPVVGDNLVKKRDHTSKSVIFQFDPLYQNSFGLDSSGINNPQLTNTNETLEHAIAPYGKINKVAILSETSLEACGGKEKSTNNLQPPSIPPRNYETIAPISVEQVPCRSPKLKPNTLIIYGPSSSTTSSNDAKKCIQEPSRVDVRPTIATREQSVPEGDSIPFKGRISGIHRVNSLFKKTLKSVADVSLRSANKASEDSSVQAVERPILSPQLMVHCCELYKATVNEIGLRKDFVKRYSILAEGKLTCYSERNCSEIREVVPLDTVLSIQLVLEQKVSSNGSPVHCLELTTYGRGRKLSHHMYGSSSSTERKVWMQKLLESVTTVFSTRISCDFERAGWCFIRQGISGIWSAAWILLAKRMLMYCLSNGILQEIDLRKARCVELQDSGPNSPKVAEKGQIILVDFPGQSIYLQADIPRETITWRNIIKTASVENGPNLSQQQLTRDDIPAIVDKCISFVYAHGSMSEGIYRKSGSNSNIERLLKQFRQDAWSVQLSRQDYSEYDIASTLKRFFRDLPESLFTTELHSELCEIAEGKFGNDKLLFYRKTLEKLPPINFLTARKLLGHLYFIHEQHEKNLMPVDNLSSIWGPTLLHSKNSDSHWSKVESSVVADLIILYPSLFDVDIAELTREKRILETLERIHAGNSNISPNKRSGDLKVWIHIGTRDSKHCAHVTIGPQKRAEEVCVELSSKMSVPAHQLCLEEVVYGGALVRPLHHTELVLDTVLRWGYWDESARKNNCLVLRKNAMFSEVAPVAKPPFTYSGELRFADRKTKAFKSYVFEFSQAKLCYYKDKSASNRLGEWKIEDIVWYIGYEPKRNPQTRWSITFIDRHNYKQRAKDNPFFGCTIAGTSKDEQLKWMAAMLMGEYPQGLLPTPALIQ